MNIVADKDDITGQTCLENGCGLKFKNDKDSLHKTKFKLHQKTCILINFELRKITAKMIKAYKGKFNFNDKLSNLKL